jgi:hypothetical protein
MSQPNPLFGRKTELIWDGKYDDAGRRVAPLRVALPFQTVETVNETAQERQKSLLLFEALRGHSQANPTKFAVLCRLSGNFFAAFMSFCSIQKL